MILKKEDRRLECELSETDRALLGQEIASETAEIDELERDVASHQDSIKSLKDDIKSKSKARAEKATEWSNGTGYKYVACTLRIEGSEVVVTRDDTGEEVDRRKATPNELQQVLPMGPEQEAIEPAKDPGAPQPSDTLGAAMAAAAAAGAASVTMQQGDKTVRVDFQSQPAPQPEPDDQEPPVGQPDVVADVTAGIVLKDPLAPKPAKKRGKKSPE